MLGNKGFFVFSVSTQGHPQEHNDFRTGNVIEKLLSLSIPFKTVKGCYKGFKETSFVVKPEHENTVLDLARTYKQESILFVNGKSLASLYYLNSDEGFKVEQIGTWSEVSRTKALESNNYTYDDVEQVYYSVK